MNIAYREVRRQVRGDIVVADVRSGARIDVTNSESDERFARFSGDGRWIAYVSDETGRPEVFVQPFPPTGAKWQVTVAGGDEPAWRGDGRELYYVDPSGALIAIRVENVGSTFIWTGAQPLFQIGKSRAAGFATTYDVARDGSRFLVAVPVSRPPGPPATVLVNWPSRLQRR